MKELIEKRTPFSKVYDKGDKIVKEIYSYPVHYKTEEGKYEEVDCTIREIKAWEFTNGNYTNHYRSYFGDSTDSENPHLFGVEIEGGGKSRWLNLKLKGANPRHTSVEDNRVLFKECFGGPVDVEYILLPEKVKENIVIHEDTGIRSFLFTIKSDGVILSVEDEKIYVKDSDTGETLWVLDKPFMEDAAGEVSYGVRYAVGHDGEFQTVSIDVEDETFMTTAQYPVIIDPVVELDYSEWLMQDTYITHSNSNTSSDVSNFGNAAILQTINGYVTGHILIQMKEPYEGSSEDWEVAKAVLKLYQVGYEYQYELRNLDFYYIMSPWDRTQVTYRSRPTKGSYMFHKEPTGDIRTRNQTWWNIDITNYYKYKKLNGIEDFGIWISPDGSSGIWDTTHLQFASSRNSNVDIRPRLEITYIKKPTLGFHDGELNYYSGSGGDIFKYLDFGTLIAGQTSLPQRVYLRNLSPFEVENVSVRVDNSISPSGVQIQISKYNNPFVPEEYIVFDGVVLGPDEDLSFFVRIATEEGAITGGNFPIMAKAIPRQ